VTEIYTSRVRTGRINDWLAARRGVSLGSLGEWAVLKMLYRMGWELVARNWSTRAGELDLVMYEGKTLVFVEVKTRVKSPIAIPEDNFSPRKFDRIESLAWSFLERYEVEDTPVRFDLAAVETEDRRIFWIRHYRGLGDYRGG